MLLLAAFCFLLVRRTGQRDILIWTNTSGRHRAEAHGVFGFFVNLLPLRFDLSGIPNFNAMLARVKETTLDAFSHQDVPFCELFENIPMLGGTPLKIEAICDMSEALSSPTLPGLKVTRYSPTPSDKAPGWLDLKFRTGDGFLSVNFGFNPSCHHPEYVGGLAKEMEHLLDDFASNPDLDLDLTSGLGLQARLAGLRHSLRSAFQNAIRKFPNISAD
jgi:hypothetical protein